MKWITKDEAAVMYARFLAARHGTAAIRVAREKAEALKLRGDIEGHAAWSRVVHALKRRVWESNNRELEGVTP